MDAVILTIWFATDPFQWTIQSSSKDLNGYITEARGECASEGDNYYLYPLFIAILHFVVLVYANILAYQTSRYHKISGSKSVAICLFNSIQLLLIGAPIVALVGDNVATSYLIRICFVFLNNFGVLLIIVLPKLYQCMLGKGDKVPTIYNFTKSEAARSQVGGFAGMESVNPDEQGAGIAGESTLARHSSIRQSSVEFLVQRRPPTTSLNVTEE